VLPHMPWHISSSLLAQCHPMCNNHSLPQRTSHKQRLRAPLPGGAQLEEKAMSGGSYRRVKTTEDETRAERASSELEDDEPSVAELAKHEALVGYKRRQEKRRWLRQKVEAAAWITACCALMWCVVCVAP
jgi:hypothetical protein